MDILTLVPGFNGLDLQLKFAALGSVENFFNGLKSEIYCYSGCQWQVIGLRRILDSQIYKI
ncbi:MAG: hypothetical protein A2Z86_00230 [Candidatus Glassbacteria bacterium GWA2_58_10]|uniref:Uncharacterized protein n=1 Tax=Candidatus Glassbacteria bacterium GWA2_58_10 TaxID=1817865 RepID=A0A1F5YIF4_9BACT|nr:MAG: hypothetical protein A2Z86_00230 [Candidatus Glassbacteria bacterium GWA2_58_10]